MPPTFQYSTDRLLTAHLWHAKHCQVLRKLIPHQLYVSLEAEHKWADNYSSGWSAGGSLRKVHSKCWVLTVYYDIHLEGLNYISYRGSMWTTPQGIQVIFKWKRELCEGTEKGWKGEQSSVSRAPLGINRKPTAARRHGIYIAEQ